jgi:hypothetical protein
MNSKELYREIAVSTGMAIIGGAAGFFLFDWLLGWEFYALILPAAGVGLGGGAFARRASHLRAACCAAAGLALGIFSEWYFFPFKDDGSFGYFLTHLHEIDSPVTWLLLILGALLSYWFAYGRNSSKPQAPSDAS